MEKEYFLGIDLHKEFALWTLIDQQRNILLQAQIKVEEKEIKERTMSLPPNTRAALEPTCSWEKYSDLLKVNGIKEVKIAHPLKTKAISLNKLKNDKVDSLMLAELLRTNFLPEAYLSSQESRQLKQILQIRMFLKRKQAKLKQKLQEILIRLQIEIPFSNPWAKQRRDWFKSLLLSQPYQLEKEIILDLITVLEEKVKRIDKFLKDEYQQDQDILILITIPGIGFLTSLYLKAEIDNIKRFSSSKKLASFSGLVPSSRDSGGKIKRSRITKAGSKTLRWILYEATMTVNPKWGNLYYFYQRIAQKGSKKKARVSLARKLLCLCYCLLKERRPYVPDNRCLLDIKEAQPRKTTGPLIRTERSIEVSL